MKLRVIKSPEHKLLNCVAVWGGKKKVRMIEIFWAHNDQKLNQNQTHKKSGVFLAVVTHTVLPNSTAGSEHMHLGHVQHVRLRNTKEDSLKSFLGLKNDSIQ